MALFRRGAQVSSVGQPEGSACSSTAILTFPRHVWQLGTQKSVCEHWDDIPWCPLALDILFDKHLFTRLADDRTEVFRPLKN